MRKRQTPLFLAILALLWLVYAGMALIGLNWPGNILSPLISGLSACLIIRCATVSVHYRFTWIYLACGAVLWAIADIIWLFIILVLGQDPQDSVFLMYLYLLPNIAFVISVLHLALYDRRRWTSFQFIVDAIAVFCALCGFLYFTLYATRFESLLPLNHENAIAFVGLIADMVFITFSVSFYLALNRRKIPFFLMATFIGLLVYASADISYVNALLNNTYVPNAWGDALFMLGIAILGSGAAVFLDNPVDPVHLRKEVNTTIGMINRSLLLLVIPLFAILTRRIMFRDLFFFIGVVLVHQIISRMISELLRRELELEEKSRQAEYLEATIADRTRELRIMNQTLENLLKRDAITGLFNRKFFLETTEEWINNGESDEKVWLLILDFDRFKTINDTYGHDAGDQVLRIIGKRLDTLSNDRTILARLGGDEFGFVCRRQGTETITALLHTISDMIVAPVQVGLNSVHASLSIGVASWPEDARTRSDLMRHADIAMYIAKSRRTSGISFFDLALTETIERSHQIDLALKTADFDKEFTLVYQPQFATGGRRLVGMEALVRWNCPSLGPIPPDDFIPVAEENGVINPLSDWILRKALTRISEWNKRYGRNLLMGINISPHQLDDVGFLVKLEVAMDECGVRPEWVNLEFTERVAMKGEIFMIEIFTRLNRLNITSSIDDFGTGYSSLSYIKKFEIDYLKIAKQLVDGIVTNETDELIVQAIIMMATALHLRTIAEGVEDEEQLAILERLGCDEIQGYLLGKPVSPEEFEVRFLQDYDKELEQL